MTEIAAAVNGEVERRAKEQGAARPLDPAELDGLGEHAPLFDASQTRIYTYLIIVQDNWNGGEDLHLWSYKDHSYEDFAAAVTEYKRDMVKNGEFRLWIKKKMGLHDFNGKAIVADLKCC